MRDKWMRVGAKALLAGVVAFGTGGCATTVVSSGTDASLGPTLSVEKFLNAANSRDHYSMAQLFGTVNGPIGDTGSSFGCAFKKMGSWIGMGDSCTSKPSIELRMDAIARILRHEDYRIRSEERVAGRNDPTTQINVDMDLGPRTVSAVPFVVVKASNGSWLVQEIDLARLTS